MYGEIRLTDIFYDCLMCEEAGRKNPQEADIMIIKIAPTGLTMDLVCKKCSGIKRARMSEGGKIAQPLKYRPNTSPYKPKSYDARLHK